MNQLETEKSIIRKYLNVQYKLRGRTIDRGLDCYGLIIAVYKDLGFTLLDIEEEYGEDWAWKGRNHFIENYHSQWEKMTVPSFLDVVLFKNSKGIANHGGIMLRADRFLHCSKANVTVGRLSQDVWERRIEGFYHLKVRT